MTRTASQQELAQHHPHTSREIPPSNGAMSASDIPNPKESDHFMGRLGLKQASDIAIHLYPELIKLKYYIKNLIVLLQIEIYFCRQNTYIGNLI